MKIISRPEAKAHGLKRYFTGKACKRGHIDERYVASKICAECAREERRGWRASNPEAHKEQRSAWIKKNPQKRKQQRKEWGAENREYLNAYSREWHRAKQESDPDYRLARSLRQMARRLIRYNVEKSGSTYEILGYTANELKAHIEKQFSKGMSWDNYGDWHIDHITSVIEHIRSGERDPAVINCLTNLRPIWAGENMSKGGSKTHLL